MKLMLGDCLERMKEIEDGSIDAVITDPPYGTTKCRWDSVIPFESMWEQLIRITKKNGAIILFGSQPFTSALIMSKVQIFKYCWVWNKITARGHLVAKKRPMAQHEDIVVFYTAPPTYNPQMVKLDKPRRGTEGKRTEIMGGDSIGYTKVYTHSYPKTILTFGMDKRNGHPTQKPVALMEYLIKTYTNEGDTILDFTMGSGSTGVACINLNRNFIGIELKEQWFHFAQERIQNILTESMQTTLPPPDAKTTSPTLGK